MAANSTAPEEQEPLLVGISEACRLFNVAPKTMRRYARLGLVPSVRIGNRHRFSLRALRELAEGTSRESR